MNQKLVLIKVIKKTILVLEKIEQTDHKMGQDIWDCILDLKTYLSEEGISNGE